MAVHLINILRHAKNVVVEPEMCFVKARNDRKPSYLLFVFDQSFGDEPIFNGGASDFPWEHVPHPNVFKNMKIYKGISGGGIILMEDHHFVNSGTTGNWRYLMGSIANKIDGEHCDRDYMRNERHPVIINK